MKKIWHWFKPGDQFEVNCSYCNRQNTEIWRKWQRKIICQCRKELDSFYSERRN